VKTFLFVMFINCNLLCFVSADDVFASSAHLRLLADGEQRLVDAVTDYLTTERRRLLQLDQLDTTNVFYISVIVTVIKSSLIQDVNTNNQTSIFFNVRF